MAATNNKAAYAASATVTTTGIASMATAAGLNVGWSFAEIDNTTNLYFDYWVSGKLTTGTTPTANTVIEVWIIPKKNDSAYHDTFDGTSKAVTVTNRQMLQSYGKQLCIIENAAATSNVGFEFSASVLRACESFVCPAKFQIYVTHNTGVNLNSTAGNHLCDVKGYYSTSGG